MICFIIKDPLLIVFLSEDLSKGKTLSSGKVKLQNPIYQHLDHPCVANLTGHLANNSGLCFLMRDSTGSWFKIPGQYQQQNFCLLPAINPIIGLCVGVEFTPPEGVGNRTCLWELKRHFNKLTCL